MTPQDIVLIVILALAVGGAGFYVYKEKKNGRRCIGCPYNGKCQSKTSCQCHESDDEIK